MFLIIGSNSKIGRAVIDEFHAEYESVLGMNRHMLDLHDIGDWIPPDGTSAACITAAVSLLTDCEADPTSSMHVNLTGTVKVAERLTERKIYTLFLSSNQVFYGTTARVLAHADLNPLSEYGLQKASTEIFLRRMMADGAPVGILRLSKVIFPNMFSDWRENLKAGLPIRAFDNMTFSPVPITNVVQAITMMMREGITEVAQLSGPRDITYLEAARYLAEAMGADPGLVEADQAIGLPIGATPEHTTLDSEFMAQRGIVVPDANEVMKWVAS